MKPQPENPIMPVLVEGRYTFKWFDNVTCTKSILLILSPDLSYNRTARFRDRNEALTYLYFNKRNLHPSPWIQIDLKQRQARLASQTTRREFVHVIEIVDQHVTADVITGVNVKSKLVVEDRVDGFRVNAGLAQFLIWNFLHAHVNVGVVHVRFVEQLMNGVYRDLTK